MNDRDLRPALGALRTRVRALYLVHGTGRVAAALAGLLLLSVALDVVLRPPLPVRAVHGLLSLAAFAWVLRACLVSPLRRSATDLTDEELAMAVEARVPSLQDRLVSSLQWERLRADPDSGESHAFMAATAAEAAEAVRRVRAGDLTDPRPARRAALLGGVAALVFVATAAASGETALLWARRSLLLQDEPWPRRTTLIVVGFDPATPRVVTVGDDLAVPVRVEGEIPEDGILLHYQATAEGGRTDRDSRPMLQADEDPRGFAFVFHEVPGSFRFWVTGGDDDDGEPRYEVTALVPPAIEEIAADLEFPPATGKAPERRMEGDLEVPAGTTVRLAIRASVPLRSATLVHPAPAAAPSALAVAADGRTVSATVVVRESADWRVDMVAADGARSVPARTTRRFTAVPDPRPEVRLLAPATRQFAVADGRVPVKVRATDNYALTRVALDIVPGRGRDAVEIPLWDPPAAKPNAPPVEPSRAVSCYRLLDLASLAPPDGARGPGLDDEILIRGSAADNGGSSAATDQVAVQVTDAAEMLRRLSQRQTRVREDLDAIRRRIEEARTAALRARDALAPGTPLSASDRDALRAPGGAAGRAARESAALADTLGEVLLTYALNRLVENGVASERVVGITDAWLRDDDGPAMPVFKPALWRRLAAAHSSREIDDAGILGSLLTAAGLADRLGAGPATVLRDRVDALAAGTAPPAAAEEAVQAADEALALVREIALHLRQWETLHEILEAARSLLEQQRQVGEGLRGAPPAPEGK